MGYAEAVKDITNCTKPDNETSGSYAKALWDKSGCCAPLYDEATLKGIFIEGLPESIQSSGHHHWARTNAH